MKLRLYSLTALAGIALFGSSFCKSKVAPQPAGTGHGFAVVELFTSEGCSSCPPADEAMIRLAREFPERVYFIGYHVDYWDYIGWKDIYASADFTERQQQYANAFGLKSIYTPQAIVNGETELVGSREGELKKLIQDELTSPATAALSLTTAQPDSAHISVVYKLSAPAKSVLHIVLVQKMAVSKVKRGENNGRELHHVNIARALKTVNVEGEAGSTISLAIPPGISRSDIKVIAFVQEKGNKKILAAAAD